MMPKTPITKTELVPILAQYELGTYLNHEPLTAGSVETNIHLLTTSGDYVFRLYENRSYEAVLFECALIEHLTQHDYPCPRLYHSRSGDIAGILGGKPYVLFEFIEGEHLQQPSQDQQRQLVENIARLHLLTEGFSPPHMEKRWNYNPEVLIRLAEQETRKIRSANALRKLDWYKSEIAKLDLPQDLPRGIVHGDFHFSNILFQAGQFKALIDFDDANYTVLLFDLISVKEPFKAAFNHASWSTFSMEADVFDFSELRRILAIYTRVRPINEHEKQHLFDVCKLMVFTDCIWFYARGVAEDFFERRKIHYLNQLGREGFYQQLFS